MVPRRVVSPSVCAALAVSASLSVGCSDDPPPPPPVDAPPVVEAPAEDTGQGGSRNRNPQLTRVNYSPGRPTTADHIRLEVAAEDPDGDTLRYQYQWSINGKEMAHLTRDNIPGSSFDRGDVVVCEVTVEDGKGGSASRKTAEIEIVNSPPVFQTDPRQVRNLDGLQLQASDPDGDKLTFSMRNAPAGMTIDRERGVIRYRGTTQEKGGHYEVVATVDDGVGGTATWTFALDVSAGSAGNNPEASAEAAPEAPAADPNTRERRRTAW